jgi:serine O-acetyltransferase
MIQQLQYFYQDLMYNTGYRKGKILLLLFSPVFVGIFWYRLEHGLYQIFKKAYHFLRIPLLPIDFLIRTYSNLDISYTADIGPGLKILQGSKGIVISGHTIIGCKLTLAGGNVIGGKHHFSEGDYVIGNNCTLGTNAVIIGPVKLGHGIIIGASSCVLKDCKQNKVVLGGIPARVLKSYALDELTGTNFTYAARA